MLAAVQRTIDEHALLTRGDRVLVGISGGPDSTALLHVLRALEPRLGFSVCAATVDHGLRTESAGEAQAVVRQCRDFGVACDALRVDVAAAKKPHGSLQSAARDARLAALQKAALGHGCGKIALGHTADDQAETVLFRILRGTGMAGLAGIPYERDGFIRPLLDVRRAQILAYVHKRNLRYVSDPSNANRRFARARLRHDVLPSLARENPRIVDALLSLARDARTGGQPGWRRSLPADLYLPASTVPVIDRLVRAGAGTRTVSVPGGEVVASYGDLVFMPAAARGWGGLAGETIEATIAGPGCYRILPPPAPALVLARQKTATPAGTAAFDRSMLSWPLHVRSAQPGDRMRPRGGRGSRKLSDLLIDAKVARHERARLPLLCDANDTVLFVPGLRPSELGRPTDATTDWIEVHVLR